MLNKLTQLREERAEGEKGFTLIELLVVVVIIGVLVAIAIPLYLNYRKGAENRSAQSDVRNAISAIESCIGDNAGVTPGTNGTTYTSTSTNVVINLTCVSDGSGTVTPAATATTGNGTGTINISTGDTLSYKPVTNSSYTIVGHIGASTDASHSWFKYDSTTGKTTTSATLVTN